MMTEKRLTFGPLGTSNVMNKPKRPTIRSGMRLSNSKPTIGGYL